MKFSIFNFQFSNIKKLKSLSLISLALICLSAYFAAYPHEANAQTSLPLTVAPARQELTVDPGQKTAVIVKFYNRGSVPASGLLKVADFIVKNDQGAPTFLEGPSQASPRFAAASWVSLPYDRITIAAKDKVLIQAQIKVPADARPGGRYLAIYFQPGGAVPPAGSDQKEVATTLAWPGWFICVFPGQLKKMPMLIR